MILYIRQTDNYTDKCFSHMVNSPEIHFEIIQTHNRSRGYNHWQNVPLSCVKKLFGNADWIGNKNWPIQWKKISMNNPFEYISIKLEL